jgi:replicative DNA helicase
MYAEKLLPNDVEAEEAVVGSVLIDGDCFVRLGHLIKPGDFYRERNQLCFAACVALFQRNEAIDQVTLARELSRNSQLETVGGMAYLSHLVSVTPTSAHSEHYAQAVARAAAMRRLIDAASRISAIGYGDTDDVEATLRQAENLLFSVRSGQTERGFIPLRQVYDQYLEERAAMVDPLTQRRGPIMAGYGDLDELLGGLQPSDMIILGARPALGKSTLALNVSINAARDGATVGIFSLEMSREQLGLRILSADAEVDSHRLRLGLYTEAEEQRIIDSIGQLSELPVYIDDSPFQGMVEMRSKARRLSLEHGLDLLVVDYLQLIQGRGRGDNRVQEISEISRSLKGMARDLQVPLITCSQMSRVVENRPGHRPQLSDLRDSGSIEQDADLVLFIHREDVYFTEEEWEQHSPGRPYPKNIAEIIVAKHRNGPTGSVKLYFRDNLVRFDPLGQVDDI